ncbi:MAG: ATP-binding cassette domain-containing protein [Steroidobacteraceae bacterium]
MNVLEIDNVTKRFGNLVAVRDVSLNVAKGEMCAIIGPNGAGKTTFFNLISGFFPPTSGNIIFDGRDITRLSTHERVTRGMARTFQITEIFPELTVFENVRISAEVAGGYRLRPWIGRSDAAKLHAVVEETLKLVSLEGKADRPVGELAHGDQRAAGKCNDSGYSPMLRLFPQVAQSWNLVGMTEMNDPRLNQQDQTLAPTGSHDQCTNDYGVYDMVGNLHEWTNDPNGTFQGGYYLDTHKNGDGCSYRTVAHEFTYHDYSTGFRCCASPVAP